MGRVQNKKKRDKWCNKQNSFGVPVRDACRIKCGECCADDPDFTFQANGKTRHCEWITGMNAKQRRNEYCHLSERGIPVKEACMVACNLCSKTSVSFTAIIMKREES